MGEYSTSDVLGAFAIFGFGYCFAMLSQLIKPRIKSAAWSWYVRRKGKEYGKGSWKVKSVEEKTDAKREEYFRFANLVKESDKWAIWWFKLGAIYWANYELMWAAKLWRGEFTTRDQAFYFYDRMGWNNVLEMNRWQIAESFKEMAPMIEQNQKEGHLIAGSAFNSLEQVKKLK